MDWIDKLNEEESAAVEGYLDKAQPLFEQLKELAEKAKARREVREKMIAETWPDASQMPEQCRMLGY